jgi:hypothetical protein
LIALQTSACSNDSPLAPGRTTAQLALHAHVIGLATDVSNYQVKIGAFYRRVSTDSVSLSVTPSSVSLESGQQITTPVSVDIAACLQDAQRVDAAAGGCRLQIALQLVSGSTTLDTRTEQLEAPVQPGDRVSLPAVTLSPPVALAIVGAGTGNGTVTAPATAGQTSLNCAISGGSPAATGCTQTYPYGTVVPLTATSADGSAFTGWTGGGCSGSASPCSITLAGAQQVTASFEPVTQQPPRGTLAVRITGLPSGANAAVTVTGPGGFSQLLTATQTLPGLTAGTYAITAAPVPVTGQQYIPAPATQSLTIAPGQAAEATISYSPAPPVTGALTVGITGLPAGANAAVTVTGPGGFSRRLTATQTLTGLAPGDYTIAASPVSLSGQQYQPAPATQGVTIAAGQTANASVSYSLAPPTTGTLTVAITGLPAGANATVAVTGPGGFSRRLTATETLAGLTPGTYTVTADTVTVSGQQHAPSPLSRTVQVQAGQSSSASVTYSAVPPVLVVSVQTPVTGGLPFTVTVSIQNTHGQLVTNWTTPVTVTLPDGEGGVLAKGTAVPSSGVATVSLTLGICRVRALARATSGNLTPVTSSPFGVDCPIMADVSPGNPDFGGRLACPNFASCRMFAVKVTTPSGQPVPGVIVEWANVETEGTTCDHIVRVDLKTDNDGVSLTTNLCTNGGGTLHQTATLLLTGQVIEIEWVSID